MDATLPLPASEDDLVVLGLLGVGGFAEVRHAYRRNGAEALALKRLVLSDPEAERRLRKEGAILRSLDHPNVLPVYEVREWEGRPALLTAFAPGGSLARLLEGGPLPLPEALDLFRDIVAGVDYVHAAGIVHRDLKPSNILLTRDAKGRRRPWVADFGLARVLTSDSSRTTYAIGTPPYMAPEQYTDPTNLDERVDIYALGWILGDLVGWRPGRPEGAAPAAVRRTIEACTVRSRDDRPRTCAELLRLLDRRPIRWRMVLTRATALAAVALPLVASFSGTRERSPCPLLETLGLDVEPDACITGENFDTVIGPADTCAAFRKAILGAGGTNRIPDALEGEAEVFRYTLDVTALEVRCDPARVRVDRFPRDIGGPPSGGP